MKISIICDRKDFAGIQMHSARKSNKLQANKINWCVAQDKDRIGDA
jgi:hypothetical protein